jgi:excisionase family DNA binding protein
LTTDHLTSPSELGPNVGLGPRTATIEPWIGAEDVALVLGVSTDWVYERAALGDLPSYKFGGHRRFRVSEVEEWAYDRASGKMVGMRRSRSSREFA